MCAVSRCTSEDLPRTSRDPHLLQLQRRRRKSPERPRGSLARFLLAIVALGTGAVAAFAFAWSSADGRLHSITASPQTVVREGAEQEVERLRRRMDELEREVRELTQAHQQANDTIAALRAAQEEARAQVPPPVHWYSNPAALNPRIANEPEPGSVALPSPRPSTPGRNARDVRGRLAPPRAP